MLVGNENINLKTEKLQLVYQELFKSNHGVLLSKDFTSSTAFNCKRYKKDKRCLYGPFEDYTCNSVRNSYSRVVSNSLEAF